MVVSPPPTCSRKFPNILRENPSKLVFSVPCSLARRQCAASAGHFVPLGRLSQVEERRVLPTCARLNSLSQGGEMIAETITKPTKSSTSGSPSWCSTCHSHPSPIPSSTAMKTAESEHEPVQQKSEDMHEILRKMKETGLAILDGLCKNGLVQESMKLFDLMREKSAIPEVVICIAVVEQFCKASMLNNVLRFFEKMLDSGVISNAFSYWLFIELLCKGVTFDDAVGFCVEMSEARNSPNAATFELLVDIVCKAKGFE